MFADEIKQLKAFLYHNNHAFYLDYHGTYVVVYVNDLQIVGPGLDYINCLKTKLASPFKITDFGRISCYLKTEIGRRNDIITVLSTVYINQLLAAYQMSHCNTVFLLIIERLSFLPAAEKFLFYNNKITAHK